VPNFLLEVGTEELPAPFASIVAPQLKSIVESNFIRKNISYQQIECTSTPRRILLVIYGLADKAKDSLVEIKGPPGSQAFIDGDPSPAAIGFAKRYNVSLQELEVRKTPKGPFVFATKKVIGEEISTLLTNCVPEWINKIQGKRFMRWANGNIRFSRPIRWVVCLFNDKVLPIEIPGSDKRVISSNITSGHRLVKDRVIISSIENYHQILKDVGVIVDRSIRKDSINKLVKEASIRLEALAEMPGSLLEELTDLVESPSLIECDF